MIGSHVYKSPNNLVVPVERLGPDALDQLVGVWLERIYTKCNRDMPWDLREGPSHD